MTSVWIKQGAVIALAFLFCGCAHNYVTPGGSVSLAAIDDVSIEAAFRRVAASPFPARVAVARVQASGYASRTNRGESLGGFSIITTRDIESDDAFDQLARLPLVSGVATLNRLLLPGHAETVLDLRQPAARLKADMLLLYSIDTTFAVDGRALGPLSVISLGFIRNKTAHVTATVSGVLIDVRTGFVYGATEATATEHQRTTVWATGLATDAARLKAEQSAFSEFTREFATLWAGVLNVHAARPVPAADEPPGREIDGWYRVDY